MATGETEPAGQRPPVPDPTTLTTEQMLREIKNLKELLLGKIAHEADICTVQFANVDKAFGEIAKRTAEQKTDTKDALDAALRAAKDAVSLQTEASDKAIAKSEAATTKQIDALGVLVEKSDEAKDEKINDLKSRLDRLEAAKEGGAQATTTSRDSARFIAAMIGLGLTILLAAITVASFAIANK